MAVGNEVGCTSTLYFPQRSATSFAAKSTLCNEILRNLVQISPMAGDSGALQDLFIPSRWQAKLGIHKTKRNNDPESKRE